MSKEHKHSKLDVLNYLKELEEEISIPYSYDVACYIGS